MLLLRVRIPPGAWMFVCCDCCLLSGRGLCDGLITRPEKSYHSGATLCVIKKPRTLGGYSPLEGCKIQTHNGFSVSRKNIMYKNTVYSLKKTHPFRITKKVSGLQLNNFCYFWESMKHNMWTNSGVFYGSLQACGALYEDFVLLRCYVDYEGRY